MEWKPISEAPKDGTWVLCCYKDNASSVRAMNCPSEGHVWGKWDKVKDKWVGSSSHVPTHFQELPKPPTTTEEK